MRTKLIFLSILLMAAGLVVAADTEVGIYADRLLDPDLTACPVCGRPIRSGPIHQDAEMVLLDELRQGLADHGIKYSLGRNDVRSVEAFVYRDQERQGGNFAVDKPASVGFHLHLYDQQGLAKVFVFDETQQPLFDNILKIATFLKRGMKWITASQLAEEGIDKGIKYLQEDLK
ncbi:MAG TPA: hypothetical protein VLX12_05985 [Syntrophorhabdales bacterium]|nr:hypothetical protein [Syntrophorhabdales bacterium]